MFGESSFTKNEQEGGTLEEMQLPHFRSYAFPYDEDPEIIKYGKERAIIQERLKGKSFVDEVLNRLCKCSHVCAD